MIHALVLVCVAQASAQNNPLEQLDPSTVAHIMARKPIAELVSKAGLHPRVEKSAPAALVPLTATDFKAAPHLLQKEVAASQNLDPQAQKQLIASMDAVMDGFERTQRGHNVASALAWLIFNSVDPFTHMLAKLTDAQGDAVVAAVNDELAASPAFRKMTEVQKQRLYETCLITAGGLLSYQKTNDVESAQKLGKTIIESFAKSTAR